MSHVDAAANETREVPLASQSAVAGIASAVADTLANQAKVVPPASQSTASSPAGQPASAVADLGTGEVIKAMALRVKYRLNTDLGANKRRLPLIALGVHPKNRDSVYPDRQQDTHATTPAVAGAADPPIEEEVEEDEPDEVDYPPSLEEDSEDDLEEDDQGTRTRRRIGARNRPQPERTTRELHPRAMCTEIEPTGRQCDNAVEHHCVICKTGKCGYHGIFIAKNPCQAKNYVLYCKRCWPTECTQQMQARLKAQEDLYTLQRTLGQRN